MKEYAEDASQQWDLDAWQEALTIHVGTAYACRECGNLVMVTKGGVGVMRLNCCGRPMDKVRTDEGQTAEASA